MNCNYLTAGNYLNAGLNDSKTFYAVQRLQKVFMYFLQKNDVIMVKKI